MKFKKDGKVFEDIWGARYDYCRNITACRECGIGVNTLDCIDFCSKNPAEAARLMGYEVVEDGEDINVPAQKAANMDKWKPRICEVLGVEVGEEWIIGDTVYRINKNGKREYWHSGGWQAGCCEFTLCDAINHPENIIRKPRFTEEEVAFAKAMYAVIPDGVIMRNTENTLSWDVLGLGMRAWSDNRLPYKMFPSILPGQSVKLSDIVGGDTE